MTTTSELADRIRQQITEAEAEIVALRDALAALGESVPADGRGRPGQTASADVAPASQPAKVVPLGKLLKLVGDQQGMTTSTLAKTTGGDQTRILELLKEAETEGKVTRSGQRRATRWHLVSDEGRVAGSAADVDASQAPVLDGAGQAAAAAKRKDARRKAAERRARLAVREAAKSERKRA
jgi:hypothetical protein